MMAKPRRDGDSGGDGSTPGNKRRNGGSSESVGQVQKKAKTSAEQLDPDSGKGDAPRNDSDPGSDPDTADNDPGDGDGRPTVDRNNPDDLRELYEHRDPETGRIPEDKLPEGWGYDKNGVLHDENGHKVGHPDEVAQSWRSKYFPDGFRQSTHDAMIEEHTVEGNHPEGYRETLPPDRGPNGKIPADEWTDRPALTYEIKNGIPYVVDENGEVTNQRVDRSRLTWLDEEDNPIPYYRENSEGKVVTNLQYDHQTPAAQYWNEEGYKQSWEDRQEWYNDPNNLTPMGSQENAGKGSLGEGDRRWKYDDRKPDPDAGYTPKPGRG